MSTPRTATAGSSRLWFIFLVLLSGGSWSLVFSLGKIAGEGTHDSLGLAFWQGVGGGLMLLTIAALRRRRLPLDWRSLGFYLICGIFGTALPTTLIFETAPVVGAGTLAITMALVPLMTYGAAIVLGIDRGAALRITGLSLGFIAVLLLMLPTALDESMIGLLWLLLALAIPASYSTENLLLALRGPKGIDAIALVGAFQIAGAALLLPITLATGTFTWMAGPWGEPEWAALIMLLVNAPSYALFLYVLQRTGPVFASQTTYVVTVCGVVWGMILFGEAHSTWFWGALVVTMAGIALVQERKVERN